MVSRLLLVPVGCLLLLACGEGPAEQSTAANPATTAVRLPEPETAPSTTRPIETETTVALVEPPGTTIAEPPQHPLEQFESEEIGLKLLVPEGFSQIQEPQVVDLIWEGTHSYITLVNKEARSSVVVSVSRGLLPNEVEQPADRAGVTEEGRLGSGQTLFRIADPETTGPDGVEFFWADNPERRIYVIGNGASDEVLRQVIESIVVTDVPKVEG